MTTYSDPAVVNQKNLDEITFSSDDSEDQPVFDINWETIDSRPSSENSQVKPFKSLPPASKDPKTTNVANSMTNLQITTDESEVETCQVAEDVDQIVAFFPEKKQSTIRVMKEVIDEFAIVDDEDVLGESETNQKCPPTSKENFESSDTIPEKRGGRRTKSKPCLLYTSDAADE